MRSTWDRFTLLDVVLLIAFLAIGMVIANHFARTDSPVPWMPRSVAWALEAIIYAGMMAGPGILIGHFIRGRREWLSVGEWLWLGSWPVYLMQVLTTEFVPHLLLLGTLAAAALGYLAWSAFRARAHVPCRWTDIFGCVICLLTGTFFIYVIVVVVLL